MSTTKKYRPVFTQQEIEVLAKVLKRSYLDNLTKSPYHPDMPLDIAGNERGFDQVTTDYLVQLMGKISTLESKVRNDTLAPAYTSKDPADMLVTLGAAPETIAAARGTQTKEQYWESCFMKYKSSPEHCTVPEIEAAQEHRYLHDLMTPNEVEVFEAKILRESL